MKKISGSISLLGSSILFLWLLFLMVEQIDQEWDREEVSMWSISFIVSVSVIHYTMSTKFWTNKSSEIEILDRDIEILKKQIEKQEMLGRLEQIKDIGKSK